MTKLIVQKYKDDEVGIKFPTSFRKSRTIKSKNIYAKYFLNTNPFFVDLASDISFTHILVPNIKKKNKSIWGFYNDYYNIVLSPIFIEKIPVLISFKKQSFDAFFSGTHFFDYPIRHTGQYCIDKPYKIIYRNKNLDGTGYPAIYNAPIYFKEEQIHIDYAENFIVLSDYNPQNKTIKTSGFFIREANKLYIKLSTIVPKEVIPHSWYNSILFYESIPQKLLEKY